MVHKGRSHFTCFCDTANAGDVGVGLRRTLAKSSYLIHDPDPLQPILLNEGPEDYESANACMREPYFKALALIATAKSEKAVHDRLFTTGTWAYRFAMEAHDVWNERARNTHRPWPAPRPRQSPRTPRSAATRRSAPASVRSAAFGSCRETLPR